MSSSLESSFAALNAEIEAESEKRELISKQVRELGRLSRQLSASLQSLHSQCESTDKLREVAQKSRRDFAQCREHWRAIEAIVGRDSEKYHDQWKWVVQQFIFLAALCQFVESESLIDVRECGAVLGLATLTIDTEDYLHGVGSLPNELCRLAVNVVRAGNADYVRTLASFVSDLYAGFRLLNLRNDALRRKVDSMKYQCLKLEEILYDLVVKKPHTAGAEATVATAPSTDSSMTDSDAQGAAVGK